MKGITLFLIWRSLTIWSRKKRPLSGILQLQLQKEESRTQVKKGFWCKEHLLQISALFFIVLIYVLIYVFRDLIHGLGSYGYLGAFLILIACSATIVVPAPDLMIVVTLGGVRTCGYREY